MSEQPEYNVYYHVGKVMDLGCRVHAGTLRLTEDALEIVPNSETEGATPLTIPYRQITFPSETFRLHFLCRMTEVVHREGSVFVTIPLISAFDRPVVSNSIQVQKLQREIDRRFRSAWVKAA